LYQPTVIIGVPICESKSYILDKFLLNMAEMIGHYPRARIVFAVEGSHEEAEFAKQLESYGKVIYWPRDTEQSWLQNIANAREALRKHVIRGPADYLFMADCDMTYEPSTIPKLLKEIQGYDAVFSAYRVRQTGTWGFGSSPALYTKDILRRFHWHVQYWTEKRFIAEDEMQDFDFALIGAKVKRGAFVTNTHYADATTGHLLQAPFTIPLYRRLTASLPFRLGLIGASRICHMSLAWPLYKVSHIWLKLP
jgi:hypothetical protein